MNICILPARGGSKRIPRKNIRPFLGRPMIAWPISAALESGCFSRVIVSTDDDEIASIAKEHGAEAPFVRPASLSNDFATTIDVVRHAIDWLADAGYYMPRAVCCLYAAAPFATPEDLRAGEVALRDAAFVVPVTRFSHPVQRALRVSAAGRLEMIDPSNRLIRTQDLEPTYHDTGQFYWGLTEAWSNDRAGFGPNCAPLIFPRYRVEDIDTEEHWTRAELLFRMLREDAS